MYKRAGQLKILHIVLSIGETNVTYNEHCLPRADSVDISICTYFKANFIPPKKITLYEGDNTISGFFRALNHALNNKDYDAVHAHAPHVGALYLLTKSFRRRITPPDVFTVHSSLPNYNKLKIWLLLIPVFTLFNRVVCCSQSSFDTVPMLYRWLAGNRLCKVQNGVNIKRVDDTLLNSRNTTRNQSFTVVSVGRLIDIKNPLMVLRSFKSCVNESSRLKFIGGGNLRKKILTTVKNDRLENRIKLMDIMPREQVYLELANSDLFVSASRGEGLPVATLEAMTCRCPVILSDIAPHREIANGVDFIPLINPDDVSGFAREIQRYEAMNAQERSIVGDKCRKLVEDRFNLSLMQNEYDYIYSDLSAQMNLGRIAQCKSN